MNLSIVKVVFLSLSIIVFGACSGSGSSGGGDNVGATGGGSDNGDSSQSSKISFSTLIDEVAQDIKQILELKDGTIVLAVGDSDDSHTASTGVYISNDGGVNFTRRSTADGLQRSTVNSVAEGPDGKLYVTHFASIGGSPKLGFSRSTSNLLDSFISILNPITEAQVRSVAVNSQGHIFVRGNSRLERSINGGTSFSVLRNEFSNGKVWIGKTSGRVYVQSTISFKSVLTMSNDNGNTFFSKGVADGLVGGTITHVAEDSKGNIFVVSRGDPNSGLAVSRDGGNTFVFRPLPLRESLGNAIGDISINDSDIVCVTHEDGISCSRDSGYTWSFTEIQGSFSIDRLLITNSGKIFKTNGGHLAQKRLQVSNGVLPEGMGTALPGGVIPSQVKLSNLPTGTYSRKSAKVTVAVQFSGGSKTIVTAFAVDESDNVSLDSFSGNEADTSDSTINQSQTLVKNPDGSISATGSVQINAKVEVGKVFSGSVTQTSSATTVTSSSDIAAAEAADKDPTQFVDYRFVDSNTLRVTQFIETRSNGNTFFFFIFTDYAFSP